MGGLTIRRLLPWLALAVFYLFFMARNRGMELDDALIYLRYIENAVAGRGLVYNEGVYFNGLTSPLFSYLVLGTAAILGNASLASFLVSGTLYFLAAMATATVFSNAAALNGLRFPALAGLAGALVFLSLPFFFIFYGMETGLLALLSAVFLWLMRSRRYGAAGICAALLFLTRSEGALLVFVAGICDLIVHRRLPRFSFATYVAPILIIACVYAFNHFYYGSLTPETAMAKIWQGASGLWRGAEFWNPGYLYQWVFHSNLLAVAVLACFGVVGFIALGRDYLNIVIVAYLALYAAFYVLLLIPNYGWYYSPFFAFGSFYVGYGFAYVVSAVWSTIADGRRFAFVLAAGLPLLWVVGFLSEINSVPRGSYTPYRDIGLWLRDRMKDDESLAVVEIGTIGYYSDRRIIDILGLVNPDNARFIGERRFDAWLDVYEPDYILVHEPLWDHELSLLGAAARWSLQEDCEFARPVYRLFRVNRDAAPGISSCTPEKAYVPGRIFNEAPPPAPSALGHVDGVRVAGNYLIADGWTRSPAGGAYEALGFAGGSADSVVWQRIARADVASAYSDPGLNGSGYRLTVRFDTHQQALDARGRGCLVVIEADTAAAQPLEAGGGCGGTGADAVAGASAAGLE